jgi:hypothetical protein
LFFSGQLLCVLLWVGLGWVLFGELSVFEIVVSEGCRQRACAQHKRGQTCFRYHSFSPIRAGSTGFLLSELVSLGMFFPFISPFFFDTNGSPIDIRVFEICS